MNIGEFFKYIWSYNSSTSCLNNNWAMPEPSRTFRSFFTKLILAINLKPLHKKGGFPALPSRHPMLTVPPVEFFPVNSHALRLGKMGSNPKWIREVFIQPHFNKTFIHYFHFLQYGFWKLFTLENIPKFLEKSPLKA